MKRRNCLNKLTFKLHLLQLLRIYFWHCLNIFALHFQINYPRISNTFHGNRTVPNGAIAIDFNLLYTSIFRTKYIYIYIGATVSDQITHFCLIWDLLIEELSRKTTIGTQRRNGDCSSPSSSTGIIINCPGVSGPNWPVPLADVCRSISRLVSTQILRIN